MRTTTTINDQRRLLCSEEAKCRFCQSQRVDLTAPPLSTLEQLARSRKQHGVKGPNNNFGRPTLSRRIAR